jgi:hypothetical protein
MGVMDKPVENAIGQRRIADLPPLYVLAVKVLIEKQRVIGTCHVVTTNL